MEPAWACAVHCVARAVHCDPSTAMQAVLSVILLSSASPPAPSNCSLPPYSSYMYCDPDAGLLERVDDLVSRLLVQNYALGRPGEELVEHLCVGPQRLLAVCCSGATGTESEVTMGSHNGPCCAHCLASWAIVVREIQSPVLCAGDEAGPREP